MTFAGVTVTVRGMVQGVGFQYWCVRKAREFSVDGYVANRPDGSVEVVAEGDRGMVQEFIKVLRIGPTHADVTDLKIQWYDKPRHFGGFSIEFKD